LKNPAAHASAHAGLNARQEAIISPRRGLFQRSRHEFPLNTGQGGD
jgi:hypothetical protein